MLNFIAFRSHVLQGITLCKNFPPNHWSKDDLEKWVREEYEKHYGKQIIADDKMFIRECTVCGKPILLEWLGGDNLKISCNCGDINAHIAPGSN
jgi:hypothetical protein